MYVDFVSLIITFSPAIGMSTDVAVSGTDSEVDSDDEVATKRGKRIFKRRARVPVKCVYFV